LVFTSTLAVYGHGEGGIFNETQTPKPIDPYGVAKYACEMDIQIAGEQHGFRQAESIKRALDAEFYFYSRLFGFTPADNLEPVEIK
jgi:dTDP-4-dehydrorhamnose reductase